MKKAKEDSEGKFHVGTATVLFYAGAEIIVVCEEPNLLQHIYERLFPNSEHNLDESKFQEVVVRRALAGE